MKDEYQIPEAVKEDPVAWFADEERLLLYSHFYDKGKDECSEAIKVALKVLETMNPKPLGTIEYIQQVLAKPCL